MITQIKYITAKGFQFSQIIIVSKVPRYWCQISKLAGYIKSVLIIIGSAGKFVYCIIIPAAVTEFI